MSTYISQLKLPSSFIPQRPLTVTEASNDLTMLATGLDVLTTAIGTGGTNSTLVGFSAATGGDITSIDTILSAFGKLENRMEVNDAKTSYPGAPSFSQVTSKPTTLSGYGIIPSSGDYSAFYLGISSTASNSTQLGGISAASYATQSWTTSQLTSYLTNSTAAITYLGINASAANSAQLGGIISSSYALQSWVTTQLTSYLTSSTASSTYLTISNASSTYLTISNASSTYLTISNAASTYLGIASEAVNSNKLNGQLASYYTSTTNIAEGTNLYYTDTRVRSVQLVGLSTSTTSAISSSDTILSGMGKLQAQITSLPTSLATNLVSFGALANASGYLYNNGSGTFSYAAPPVNNSFGGINCGGPGPIASGNPGINCGGPT